MPDRQLALFYDNSPLFEGQKDVQTMEITSKQYR